ncbi:MAG: hypothetical protein ACREQD_11390, partial [Candidatus Binataceae bacterium]
FRRSPSRNVSSNRRARAAEFAKYLTNRGNFSKKVIIAVSATSPKDALPSQIWQLPATSSQRLWGEISGPRVKDRVVCGQTVV